MMAEPTPEQIAMARRIAAEQIGWPTYEDAAAHNHHTDEYASVALAAIIETQRLDAEALEHLASTASCGCRPCHGHVEREATYTECIEAIRSGAHLKGQDHE